MLASDLLVARVVPHTSRWHHFIGVSLVVLASLNSYLYGQDSKLTKWEDVSGAFKIEAEFVRMDGDNVLLKNSQGKELRIPLAKLSIGSQLQAKKLANPALFEKPKAKPSPTTQPANSDSEKSKAKGTAAKETPIAQPKSPEKSAQPSSLESTLQPDGTAETAKQLIAKSEAAYAAVKSYVGTTTVRVSGLGPTNLEGVATADITFVRQGKYRIQGATMKIGAMPGSSYQIVCDGNKTWRSFPLLDKGGFVEVKDLMMAGMMGAGMGAAEGIPTLLMKADGIKASPLDPFFIPRLAGGTLVGRETIENADCYKLEANHAVLGNVTLWIDYKTHFLRQMSSETDTAKARAAAVAAGATLPANAQNLIMKRLYTFSVKQLDQPVDPAIFSPK